MKKKREKNEIEFVPLPPGVVAYPDGTILRPDDWDSDDPEGVVPTQEMLEQLNERYGKYLRDGKQPLKGINPNPKYYVTPKEEPRQIKRVSSKKVKIKVKSKKASEDK